MAVWLGTCGVVMGSASELRASMAQKNSGQNIVRPLKARLCRQRRQRRIPSLGRSIAIAKALPGLVCRQQHESSARTSIARLSKTPAQCCCGTSPTNTIRAGREKRSHRPHSANNFLKAMRGFFAWAVEDKLVTIDPTKGIKLLTGPNHATGFHTWSQEEMDRYEGRWPLGTQERLAFDCLLFTGLRRGDAVRLGLQHVRDGVITIRTEKHAKGKVGQQVTIPILPPLAASITATKTGDLTYLVTQSGHPWVKESFGTWFREACRKAGCPGSAHGLRKAGAARAAERGASERQLMAIFGWTTGKMAQHYTQSADRARLAHDAAQLLLPDTPTLSAQSENKKRPHLRSGAGASAKKRN